MQRKTALGLSVKRAKTPASYWSYWGQGVLRLSHRNLKKGNELCANVSMNCKQRAQWLHYFSLVKKIAVLLIMKIRVIRGTMII